MRRVFFLIIMAALTAGVGWGGYRIAQEIWATRHFQAAETALVQHNFERALQELELCLEVWPDRMVPLFRAARAARRAGDFDKAEKYLAACEKSGLTRPPPEVDLELERACLRAQQGDVEEVKPYLDAIIKMKGSASLLAMEALGQGYVHLRNPERAGSYLEPLLKESPNHQRVRVIRAKLALGNDDFEGAISECKLAVEAWPEAFEPRLVLAKALQGEGKIREAIKELQVLVEAYPERSEGLLTMALCRAELHQFQQAEHLYDEVLAKHPRLLTALVERGRVALHQGKAAEAEPFLQRALAVNAKDFAARDTLVKALDKQDKTEEAAACRKTLEDIEMARGLVYRDVLMLQQAELVSVDAGLALGKKLMEVGREEEAEWWFLGALQYDPRRPQTRLLLADIYDRAGQSHRAAYQRQLALRKS